jgi:hypothetical protein
MSQTWNQINGGDKLAQSRQDIVDRTETVKSNFSGTAFPATNVVQGQFCYRTDLNQLYQCSIATAQQTTWTLIADLNVGLFNKNGDTMLGPLMLAGNPTQPLQATPKQYVDAGDALALKKAGDAMLGPLLLSGDPTQALHPTTKQYVDAKKLAISGGPLTATGTLGSGQSVGHNTSGVVAGTFGGSAAIPVITIDAYGHITAAGTANLPISGLLGKSGDTAYDIYNNGWYRSNGSTGWYSTTYGGGIYMYEGSTVRVYGSKQLATDWHILQSDGRIWTSAYGFLESRFLSASAYYLNAAGTVALAGDIATPAGFYLNISGQQVQLVKTMTNCNCNCNCTCFPAGTPILLADGRTWLPVEHIRPGDMVLTPLGPMPVLEVETPELGDRRMLGFADDPFLRWTDDHAFWTRREGREGLAVVDRSSFMRGVELGVVRGLPDNDAVLELDDERDEFAHFMGGWVRQKVVDVTDRYARDTRVYLPIVGGCHLIIAAGYVMSGGANGFDFDYPSFQWSADRARASITA